MSLKDRLKAEIAALGPIGVAEYMTRCLHDPQDGYYATRPALGAEGDFVTAPLVSQMFGELIGLWAAELWDRLGQPHQVRLVEVGPGDGTLMSDLLRAACAVPAFREALEPILVETSAPLAALQRDRLAESTPNARWIAALAELQPGPPVILVANELLDCLPARQFVRTPEGWAERCVGLDADGELAFGLRPAPPPFLLQHPSSSNMGSSFSGGGRKRSDGPEASDPRRSALDAPDRPLRSGSRLDSRVSTSPRSVPPGKDDLNFGEREKETHVVFETSPAQAAFAAEVARLIVRDGGGALLIDYGRDTPEPGDTLQALRRHAKVNPLATPGEADLTVWADFPTVAAAAQAEGARVGPILTQRQLLEQLGIHQRAAALARSRPDRAATIARQLARLVDAEQMGRLFKACAIYNGPLPPGFEDPS